MEPWNERKRPVCLEKRFEFDSYSSTRDFLDRLGEFSEVRKRYPDISFGKTYVNITLRPNEDAEDATLTDLDHAFAAAIDGLID
ncbi:alpha-carboxysome RuBisCO assembly factor [Synechococcus sp. BIOS-U3-1]|uniref:4a-hydroxytetrahydrobiopterin dehydratase n=1 Tax=Synechococcus sp. BIOS-U3-1 TaxID=1400865 RepID=UPI000C67AA8A|nr:4a-hydroxytetrahydrobiopterin dehydratase [Synechococcus sp. BIOS-U3-1]MAD68580.1 pterin-4-alpha-carbinolamine dehydratase [Synechococcus sp. CPC100]QNI59258.1 alpha-carboxysome RuBisCO assembly factor [Synechococcus sp. BIOS-U3-1]|tara:strand:+ start:375 stop:626 length:252 start_codon:yes stop_codon:yes gene_type:complete